MKGLEALVRGALISRGLDDALPASVGFASFLALLLRANVEVNLVSRKEAVGELLVARHLLDALEALPLVPPPGARRLRLLDIGSGGGFPAIPLLLARRDLEGVLVESVGKKARFLEKAVGALGLTARVVNARFPGPALELMRKAPPCDLLTSRAVAGAGELVRAARPALARGAVALLWTTEPLLGGVRLALPGAGVDFRKSPGADRRGIARVECFT
ncbi:MAG TPA: RsmG family class I SAM-dependent methyltransferase [Thermoanaerobaculia bacterium]|nr:RsmG family class I SAM-dependent methyltransferase [Thermoanaerobaculia bacterium]